MIPSKLDFPWKFHQKITSGKTSVCMFESLSFRAIQKEKGSSIPHALTATLRLLAFPRLQNTQATPLQGTDKRRSGHTCASRRGRSRAPAPLEVGARR